MKSRKYCYFYALMKRRPLYVVFCLALLASAGMLAQEPRLSYNLRPGESYVLDIDIQQNTNSESINNEEISLYSRTKVEFHIDSTNGRDLIYMSAKYYELLISMLAPRLKIDINSSSGGNKMLSDMVDSLEQGTFQLVISSAGELKYTNGLSSLFSSLASYPVSDTLERQVILKTLEEVYGPDSFRSLFNLFIWVYPVLDPMSNWTNDMTYYFNTKPVRMSNRYYLTKSTDEIVVIQGLGALHALQDFHETTNMGEVKSTVSGNQTFDFQMDITTGWLKRCVSRQRVVIETTILKSDYFPTGLKIPSFTETTFEVKGFQVR